MSVHKIINFDDLDIPSENTKLADVVPFFTAYRDDVRLYNAGSTAFAYHYLKKTIDDGRAWLNFSKTSSAGGSLTISFDFSVPESGVFFIHYKMLMGNGSTSTIGHGLKAGIRGKGFSSSLGNYGAIFQVSNELWTSSTPSITKISPSFYNPSDPITVEIKVDVNKKTGTLWVNENIVEVDFPLSKIDITDTMIGDEMSFSYGLVGSNFIPIGDLGSISDIIITHKDNTEPKGRLGVTAKLERLPISSDLKNEWTLPDDSYLKNSDVVGRRINGDEVSVSTYEEGVVDEYGVVSPVGPHVYASVITTVAANTSATNRFMANVIDGVEGDSYLIGVAQGLKLRSQVVPSLVKKIGYKSVG